MFPTRRAPWDSPSWAMMEIASIRLKLIDSRYLKMILKYRHYPKARFQIIPRSFMAAFSSARSVSIRSNLWFM